MITITKDDLIYQDKGIYPAYFITCCVKDGSNKDKLGFPDFGGYRTFGFYYNLEEARAALNENRCDMHECLYDYAAIEKLYPKIHPLCLDAEDIEWYKFDTDRKGFFLDQKNINKAGPCNFALG